MSCPTLTKQEKILVAAMSQIVFLKQPEQSRSIIGSCIALTLFHSRLKIGALAHIVLPNSSGRPGPPGKFADTAIPHMLDELNKQGANTAGLVAKMCGGASMFGPSGPIQIGEENAAAVVKLLRESNIRIIGERLGGSKGRRVTFDCESGEITIEIAGQPTEIL